MNLATHEDYDVSVTPSNTADTSALQPENWSCHSTLFDSSTVELVGEQEIYLPVRPTTSSSTLRLLYLLALDASEPELRRVYSRLAQRLTFQSFCSHISEILNQFEFVGYKEFEDPLGGIVLEFFRDSDRFTFVVSEGSIQVMSCLDDEIKSELFTHLSDVNERIAVYVTGLLR